MLSQTEPRIADVHPLSDEEVSERRARFGANILVPERRSPALVWVLRFFLDPMVLLLLTAGVTYLILGDRLDAGIALGAVVPIFFVSAILEHRSDRALEQLKLLALPTARVRRGLRDLVIDAREIVPGDIMLVQEGDVFAADGVLIGGDALIVDESTLTGESQPVVKEPGRGEVFAGTALRSGRGDVFVTAIGSSTKYGRIGALMSQLHVGPTPIERAIRRIVSQVGLVVILICVAVIVLERGHGALWGAAIIAGVSLAMAALPEELPMVYTLYLAIGAWRLARERALVRRLASVETLGSANVICVDKTGTLTQGRVELSTFWTPVQNDAVFFETAVLASEPHPFDPLDAALQSYAESRTDARARIESAEKPVRSYAFDAASRRMTKIWKDAEGLRVVAKGAPETLLDLCALSDAERERVGARVETYARQGMRVIAVAQRHAERLGVTRLEDETGMEFAGLLAFSDPIRPDVPAAIEACRRAQIAVIMITGDHPETALAIARSLGIETSGAIEGATLERMHDDELIVALKTVRAFARIAPEQKLRIVQALHARGDIVAMTGDGTNDALALREADIGVAMGKRGSEVARGAADLILLDDDFTTIVSAIAGGRRIFRNLRRAFRYLNAFHMPLIVLAAVIPIFGLPLLLLPVHMIWLELIVHPTSALVYENDPAGAEDLMTQPPRGRASGLLRKKDWIRPLMIGTTLVVAVLAVYLYELRSGEAVEVARGLGLATMLFGQTLMVLSERSSTIPVWRQSLTNNALLLPILGGTAVMILAMFYVPALAEAFHIAALSPVHLLMTAALAMLATLWLEPFKRRPQTA